jgi:hypothetical protein
MTTKHLSFCISQADCHASVSWYPMRRLLLHWKKWEVPGISITLIASSPTLPVYLLPWAISHLSALDPRTPPVFLSNPAPFSVVTANRPAVTLLAPIRIAICTTKLIAGEER